MKRYIIAAALALVLTGLSILVYGYEYGTNPNQIQVLPFIEKIKDPALFGNDYYVDTLRRFPSAYPHLMAFLSRWIALEPLHLALYIICKFLLLFFAYNLALFLFRSGRTAGIAMFLFAFSPLINIYSLFGHDPLMKTAFYQTSAAAPFALAALLLFLKKRYLAASFALAFIYYINVLVGNFLFVVFLSAAGREYIYEGSSKTFRRMRLAFFAFLLLMAPAAAWLVSVNMRFPAHPSRDFVLLLKSWYPGHYFPSFWPRAQWHTIAVMLPFFLVFFRKGFGHCREKRTVQSFIWALASVWALALIFGDFLPVRFIILLQFFRSDALFLVFALIFAADYTRSLFESRDMRGIIMAGLLISALIEFTRPYYAFFVLIMLLMHEYKVTFAWRPFIIFLSALSAFYFFTMPAPAKVLCMLVLFAFLFFETKGLVPKHLLNGCMVLVAAFTLLSYASVMRYRAGTGNFTNSALTRAESDWKKLQLWARDNTPPGAVFVAPLDTNGFRVFSNRSVFVDWVDGAAMHWVNGFEDLWAGRIMRVGCGRDFMEANAGLICGFGSSDMKSLYRAIYNRLDEDTFRGLKRDFGAGYVIEESARQLSFNELYKNGSFRVYRIE